MIVQTYQSMAVLKILLGGEIYRAKPSISFKGQYEALISILNLRCECPVFGVIKGRKQNTSGRVSGKVRLTLDIPDKHIKLTEFSDWADFMDAYRYTKPGDYRRLAMESREITQREYNKIMDRLRKQKPEKDYKYPQVILEKINPVWLKKYKVMIKNSPGSGESIERFRNLFRR